MISTTTGKFINVLELGYDDIDIEDIAHALANVNRFGGHTKKPLSVAQHSVYVSRLCRNSPFRLQGLLHDASEAYIGDITYHLKNTDLFAGYRELEDRIQKLIYYKFGCDETEGQEVKVADRIMVKFEAMRLFGNGKDFVLPSFANQEFPLPTPEEIKAIGRWEPWDWKWARDVFMAEFRMAIEASPITKELIIKRAAAEARAKLTGEEMIDGEEVVSGV